MKGLVLVDYQPPAILDVAEDTAVAQHHVFLDGLGVAEFDAAGELAQLVLGDAGHDTTMSGIISNPKYKGYYVGNKVKVVDLFTKKQKFLPPEEWVMFKDETGEIVPGRPGLYTSRCTPPPALRRLPLFR